MIINLAADNMHIFAESKIDKRCNTHASEVAKINAGLMLMSHDLYQSVYKISYPRQYVIAQVQIDICLTVFPFLK